MVTPYDWQEAIGHRAQFIESRIMSGVPVVAVSLDEGILVCTFRRQTRKVFEIYDRLMYAGIGQQSDVESLRVAAIDFAHREGYQRSEQDVTIQRVVTALSQPIKDAFANFSTAPWVGKAMFMEVADSFRHDQFYCIDYDGDYANVHNYCCIAGDRDTEDTIRAEIKAISLKGKTHADMLPVLEKLVKSGIQAGAEGGDDSRSGLSFEAAILSRDKVGDRRFKMLTKGKH